jgi:hypothetical protein
MYATVVADCIIHAGWKTWEKSRKRAGEFEFQVISAASPFSVRVSLAGW